MSTTMPLSEQAQVAKAVLTEMLRQMDFPGEAFVSVAETAEQITLSMQSEEPLGLLIGKAGQTLNAIELLVTLITRHKTQEYGKRLVVDAEQYRAQQTRRIEDIAQAAAEKVRATGESVALEPMNARDRRTVHMVVAEIEGLCSTSVGEEPYRHLVICLPGQEPLDE